MANYYTIEQIETITKTKVKQTENGRRIYFKNDVKILTVGEEVTDTDAVTIGRYPILISQAGTIPISMQTMDGRWVVILGNDTYISKEIW